MISISQAAKKQGITRQGCYVSVKKNRLKATKVGHRWMIDSKDIEAYQKSKYSRYQEENSGEPLYDKKKGTLSPREAAAMLKFPIQRIYYLIRTKKLASHKHHCAWVMNIADVEAYKVALSQKKDLRKII